MSVAATTCTPAWQEGFLALLPSIERQVRRLLGGLRGEALEDACSEAVAQAALNYYRLAEQGRASVAFATPLARYAVRVGRAGRRLGSSPAGRDALGPGRRGEAAGWAELVADPRATPAEIAAVRIDFRDWLGRLPAAKRRLAVALAEGESTGDAARRLGVSAGRVSQLRRDLAESWRAFSATPAAA
ncbi:hypothetical protein Pla175_27100 [Pirellulimonas nuda]|uniref:RNA polymerase sigma factor n=1 Tax=Pirellulimonas nuda TaxID=2528009 RepID=A0A518DCW7_9BACT|nr:sigma-70 family RNA polymerase sigma factor [Pirellulimonas nuda]QDU89321.1 hypothetical protein Pla175_27100 [Pirellulimonas nuda]